MRSRQSVPFLLLFFILLSFFSGCTNLEMDSLWLDRVITIDGSDAEWENAKAYVEKANVSIGAFNDGNFLYLCLLSMDRRIEGQIMRRGLTVWLDPKGGRNKSFGIHFPLGFHGMVANPYGSERKSSIQDEDTQPDGTDREVSESAEDPIGPMFRDIRNILGTLTDMEILGPGKKDKLRMPVNGAQGIEVKMGFADGRLVYELKVPLVKKEEFSYAVGIGAIKTVSVGFETPESGAGKGHERTRGASGGEMRPEGGMGSGRGMGGRGMRHGNGGGLSTPESLRFRVKLHLASRDSTTHQRMGGN
jgi:hypothetical protein